MSLKLLLIASLSRNLMFSAYIIENHTGSRGSVPSPQLDYKVGFNCCNNSVVVSSAGAFSGGGTLVYLASGYPASTTFAHPLLLDEKIFL